MEIDTGKKQFLYELCYKLLRRKEYWRIHMRIYTGEKLYLCEFYAKFFRHKYSLAIHLKIYTGEKHFSVMCVICLLEETQFATLHKNS